MGIAVDIEPPQHDEARGEHGAGPEQPARVARAGREHHRPGQKAQRHDPDPRNQRVEPEDRREPERPRHVQHPPERRQRAELLRGHPVEEIVSQHHRQPDRGDAPAGQV